MVSFRCAANIPQLSGVRSVWKWTFIGSSLETLCSCNLCEGRVRGLEISDGVPRPGLGPHPRQHGRGHHGDGDSLARAERGSHVWKTTWEVAGTMNAADFGG